MGNLIAVTIDCTDAPRLATFWAMALDGYLRDDGGIIVQSENGPTIYFQQVPEKKANKNRVHLDVGAGDVNAEALRLKANGASVLENKEEGGHRWTVMADPEGNEFCVCPA